MNETVKVSLVDMLLPSISSRFSNVREEEARRHALQLQQQEPERMAYHRRRVSSWWPTRQTTGEIEMSDSQLMRALKSSIRTGKLELE